MIGFPGQARKLGAPGNRGPVDFDVAGQLAGTGAERVFATLKPIYLITVPVWRQKRNARQLINIVTIVLAGIN